MTNYYELLTQEEREAKKRTQTYKQERLAEVQQQERRQAAAYAQQKETLRRRAEYSQKETERQYAPMFDANAVDELVARRHAAEAIANSNLANSGFNSTQQTAISLQRMRADADTTAARQAAVMKLMQALDEQEAALATQEAADREALYRDYEQDVNAYREKEGNRAQENAARLYGYEVEREKNAAQALQSKEELALKKEQSATQARQKDAELEFKREQAKREAAGKDKTPQGALPEGFGSISADMTYTPSYVTVRTNAMMRQRNYGDSLASDYLHNMFCAGYISFEQWKTLHDHFSIVPCQGQSVPFVRAILKLAGRTRGEKEGRLFVEYLQEIDVITSEEAKGLMKDLYALN